MTDITVHVDDGEAAPVLYNPTTGEIVPLDATTDRLAEYLADVRLVEQELRTNKQLVSDEIHRRMDAEARYTARVNGWKVTGQSPKPTVEYDAQALRGLLDELVADDRISEAAADRAVERVTTFKAHHRGIEALRKQADLAGLIDEYRREVDKPRRVSVTREGPA